MERDSNTGCRGAFSQISSIKTNVNARYFKFVTLEHSAGVNRRTIAKGLPWGRVIMNEPRLFVCIPPQFRMVRISPLDYYIAATIRPD